MIVNNNDLSYSEFFNNHLVILDFITAKGTVSRKEVAANLNMPYNTVGKYFERLIVAKCLEKTKLGFRVLDKENIKNYGLFWLIKVIIDHSNDKELMHSYTKQSELFKVSRDMIRDAWGYLHKFEELKAQIQNY